MPIMKCKCPKCGEFEAEMFPKKSYNRIPKELKERVCEYIKNGLYASEIAELVNLDISQVRTTARWNNLSITKKNNFNGRIPDYKREKIKEDILAGLYAQDIGKKHGVSSTFVFMLARYSNLKVVKKKKAQNEIQSI